MKKLLIIPAYLTAVAVCGAQEYYAQLTEAGRSEKTAKLIVGFYLLIDIVTALILITLLVCLVTFLLAVAFSLLSTQWTVK